MAKDTKINRMLSLTLRNLKSKNENLQSGKEDRQISLENSRDLNRVVGQEPGRGGNPVAAECLVRRMPGG